VDYGESPDDEAFTLWQSDWPVTTDFRYGPGGHRKNAPDSTWDNLGAFAQFEGGLEWLRINLGIRYDHFTFHSYPHSSWYYPAGYVRASETLWEAQERDEVDLVRDAVTGGGGLLVKMGQHASAFANVTKGYRMWPPKFGITQIGIGVLVPSSRLEPIVSYNTEIGLKVEHPKLSGEIVGYYSHFKGWPDYTAAQFDGQDWFDFDRDGTRDGNETCYMEIASYGAICYGFEAVLTYKFKDDLLPIVASKETAWTGFSVKAGFSWNWGMILGTHDPFRHTQPAHGILAIRWDDPVAKRGWVEFGMETARRYSRIPATMESSYDYAVDPAVGGSPRIRGTPSSPYLPGWTVFNLRGGYEISSNARINVGLENIGNKEYRRAHSRIKAEAGFNLNLGLVIDFQ
jgi:outer membrane receptor protein involved in Fe transport